MKKIIFLILSICCLTALESQTALPPSPPFIEVTGTSETEIIPDEIFIAITLRERNDKEKTPIAKLEADLKQILKDLSIPLENLVLNEANADYGRYRKTRKEVITSKTYTLKLKDVASLNTVYERLDKMGVEDAYISKLNHSKLLEFTKENRIKAIKAAKEKADYLATAVNQTIGKALELSERENYVNTTPHSGYNYRTMNIAQSYSNAGSNSLSESFNASEESISIMKIKIRAAYFVKYEIK